MEVTDQELDGTKVSLHIPSWPKGNGELTSAYYPNLDAYLTLETLTPKVKEALTKVQEKY